ncbi:lipopolysaccharide assembly LapA domain-containing protein [Streptomyces sp. NPDC127051]|uniref:LapA family protein n=1 Tax=Streptomyces sp. NPDC127051 TaxID=3347119 RepID=UPI00365EB7EE
MFSHRVKNAFTGLPDEDRRAGRRMGRRVPTRSRTGLAWITLVTAALVLLLLLIFVLQNSQNTKISFFTVSTHLPVGVALLFAAIAGVLIVAIPGGGRIIQLRREARRRNVVPTPPPAPPLTSSEPPPSGTGSAVANLSAVRSKRARIRPEK